MSKVVIVGSGWAGYELARRVRNVLLVSPRNYFVFTPLLASTCVGTLEFRRYCNLSTDAICVV